MLGVNAALAVIREAIRENPRLKVALGVAALGAVISVVLLFVGGDRELAVIGGIFVVGFMFLLTIFSSISGSMTEKRPFLSSVLIWAISLIFLAAIILIFTSYFVGWPPRPFGDGFSDKQAVMIRDLSFVSNADKEQKFEGSNSYFVIPRISRVGDDFYLDSFQDEVIFIAVIVDKFRIDSDDNANFRVEVEISDDSDNIIDVRNTESYDHANAWKLKKIPAYIEKNNQGDVMKQLRDGGFNLSQVSAPVIVAISCLPQSNNMPSSLKFNVTVFDEMSKTFASRTIQAIIHKDSTKTSSLATKCAYS